MIFCFQSSDQVILDFTLPRNVLQFSEDPAMRKLDRAIPRPISRTSGVAPWLGNPWVASESLRIPSIADA
jgi:hypothetical protein